MEVSETNLVIQTAIPNTVYYVFFEIIGDLKIYI